MPIHDQGYRRYAGGRDAKGRRWLVIARAGIKTMVAKRLLLALLAVSWGPFLYEACSVYLTTNYSAVVDPGDQRKVLSRFPGSSRNCGCFS